MGRESSYSDPVDFCASGYLVLDVTAAAGELSVWGEVVFSLNYSALLVAMTSEYVGKRVVNKGETPGVQP